MSDQPVVNTEPTFDEWVEADRRKLALQHALNTGSSDADLIVKKARAFEEYLKNG
jgi:hypothetical protein